MRIAAALVLIVVIGLAVLAVAWWDDVFVPRIPVTMISLTPAPHAPECGTRCGKYLELRFKTDTNLRRLDGAAFLIVGLCPYDPTRRIGGSGLYHNGVNLLEHPLRVCAWNNGAFSGCRVEGDTPAVRAEIADAEHDGPRVYSAYFLYDSIRYFDPKTHRFRPEPVPRTPHDLCFRFAGSGPRRGPPFYMSPETRIPAAMLAKALAAAR